MNRLTQTHPFEIHFENLGGQSGVAVTRPHGNHQDVGFESCYCQKRKSDIGGPPAQKVAQGSGQDLSGRPAM